MKIYIIYRFKHPAKGIVYTWNFHEGLLYKNNANATSLVRWSQSSQYPSRLLRSVSALVSSSFLDSFQPPALS